MTTTSLAPPFVLTRPLAHRLNRPPTPVAPLAHRRRSFSPPQPVASGPSRVATGEPASALRLGLGPTFRLPSRLPGRSPVRHALRRLPFRRAALPQPGPAQERPSDWTPSHRRVPPDDSGPTSLARPPAMSCSFPAALPSPDDGRYSSVLYFTDFATSSESDAFLPRKRVLLTVLRP